MFICRSLYSTKCTMVLVVCLRYTTRCLAFEDHRFTVRMEAICSYLVISHYNVLLPSRGLLNSSLAPAPRLRTAGLPNCSGKSYLGISACINFASCPIPFQSFDSCDINPRGDIVAASTSRSFHRARHVASMYDQVISVFTVIPGPTCCQTMNFIVGQTNVFTEKYQP